MLAGVIAVCGGWAWCLQVHGRFLSTVSVVFAPQYPAHPQDPFSRATNPLAPRERGGLIRFAGITVRAVTGLHTKPETVSADLTLLDAGNYDGWTVVQPNEGGQWSYAFSDPGMRVQASGPTPDSATSKVDAAIAKIRQYVSDKERLAHVPRSAQLLIVSRPDPASAVFVAGSRTRALAGMLLLTILIAVTLRLMLRRRRSF